MMMHQRKMTSRNSGQVQKSADSFCLINSFQSTHCYIGKKGNFQKNQEIKNGCRKFIIYRIVFTFCHFLRTPKKRKPRPLRPEEEVNIVGTRRSVQCSRLSLSLSPLCMLYVRVGQEGPWFAVAFQQVIRIVAYVHYTYTFVYNLRVRGIRIRPTKNA